MEPQESEGSLMDEWPRNGIHLRPQWIWITVLKGFRTTFTSGRISTEGALYGKSYN